MSLRVVVSSPSLELSGANVLVANLLDWFHSGGIQTEWVVTGHNPTDDATWLGMRKFKFHHQPPTRIPDVRQRQKLLLEYLEERTPCIYIPNFDFDMACIAPALSPANSVVLIVHCDDKVYYDFIEQHGRLFNAIVCVSQFLTEKLRAAHSDLKDRIVHIPFGVEPPVELPMRQKLSGQPLEVAYCGRLSFYQKRIHDLARVINQCYAENQSVKFHIAGAGPDEKAFFESISEPLAAGKVCRLGLLANREVLQLLSKSDVLVMTSEFEGLPVVLLEAMSWGCVPVAAKTQSGVDELVQHGENGFLLPVGDVKAFVAILAKLSVARPLLAMLRQTAFELIRSGGFALERAATDYRKLFESLMSSSNARSCGRTGKPIVPRNYRLWPRLVRRINVLPGPQSLR